MSDPQNQSKVTVEDLLRLKRSERPSADFWFSFEKELRQKQLSALVEKRSWWQGLGLPQFLFTKWAYLPIGATAILTFTLVSVKFSTPTAVVEANGVPPDVSSPYSRELASSAAMSGSPWVARQEQSDLEAGRALSLPSTEVAVVSATPVVSPSATDDSSREESPSARSIAANLARLEQSEPELINSVLGSRLSSPARVQTSSQPTVELASLAVNASKRTRLVAHYNDRQVSAEPASAEEVRDRIARRLGDGEIYGRSRIGLRGDKVSLKF